MYENESARVEGGRTRGGRVNARENKREKYPGFRWRSSDWQDNGIFHDAMVLWNRRTTGPTPPISSSEFTRTDTKFSKRAIPYFSLLTSVLARLLTIYIIRLRKLQLLPRVNCNFNRRLANSCS
jgi:hypothetical protein